MGLDGGRSSGGQRFGDVLRHYRALAGMSQEALAEQAGLSRRGIADLERGARNSPYPDTARRLADALDLDPADRETLMTACRPAASRSLRGRYTLPLELAPLVGRHAELDELRRIADGARLVTLTGTAGVGKTRLALEVARGAESAYADGALAIDLTPLDADALVASTVAAALGVAPGPGQSPTDRVRDHVRTRQLLLVLDNCEHLVGACAELADMLLREAPGLRILTTSREPLRIPGEQVWVVPALTAVDAVALLCEQAEAGGAASFTPDELVLVGRVCARLDGLPLAIELAAAHVPALGLVEVDELLADRLDFLSRGGRLAPPRHKTLRAALDWSYELLDPTEQRVMARLSAFVGGWRLEAAQEVCSDGDISRAAVVGAMEGLIEKSIVAVEDGDAGRRFRFLETVREYAAERLAEAGQAGGATDTLDRHADYFQTLARDGAVTRMGIPYPRDPAVLELEHANLRAALQWMLAAERLEPGLNLCQALGGFWLSQGFLTEGDEWLARFLDHAPEPPSTAVAASLYCWGRLTEYAGDLDLALERLEQSRALSSALGDRTVWARACCGLGDLALHRSDYAHALDLFRSSLESARSAASPIEEAQAMLGLGRVMSLMGDPEQSRVWLDRALTLERRLGDPWGIAYILNELGQQARRAGDLDEARTLLEECHVLWRQAGTRMGERAAVMNLALVTLELGGLRRASALARDSLELSAEISDDGSTTQVRCVEIAGLALGGLGSMSSAVALVATATERRAELGAPLPELELPEIARLLDRARERLGDDAFEAAWADGAERPIAAAVVLAAEELTTRLESLPSQGDIDAP